MNFRRLLLPSLSAWLWLVVFVGLSLSDWRLVLINADGDPGFHWRTGNWMIKHHAMIRADQFSHTRFHAPLVSKDWLSEIVFAAAGNALEWNGMVLFSAALIATNLYLLHRLLLKEGNELMLSTSLVLLTAMACSSHWLARPHLTTHLLALIFLWQLREFDRERITGGALAVRLIPLMILWVNLHGAFFTGFVLISVHLAGYGIAAPKSMGARTKIRSLAVVLTGCLLASLINPNGWKLHAHIVEFLRTPLVANFTNENRSPNFHVSAASGFLLQLLVVAGMLVVIRPRLNAVEILSIGVWGFFSLQSVRNVPIFAIVVAPILAQHINEFLRVASPSRLMTLYRKVSAKTTALDRDARGGILIAIVALTMLAAIAKPRVLGGAPLVSTEILTTRFPVDAVKYLESEPHAVEGEMFNDYSWGGYLMLVMPSHKVFVDGRNDFYGPKLIQEFDSVNRLHPNWETVLQKYKVGWTILPRAHALNTLLALRTDWHLVYSDEVTIVYGRNTRPL